MWVSETVSGVDRSEFTTSQDTGRSTGWKAKIARDLMNEPGEKSERVVMRNQGENRDGKGSRAYIIIISYKG